MSLTDDAKLVVEAFSGQMADGVHYVYSPESIKAAVRLATAYIEAGGVEGGECPWCGAARHYEERYECGSWVAEPKTCGPWQTIECKDRQIANLTARMATVSAERDDAAENARIEANNTNEWMKRFASSEAELADHKRRLLEQSATLNAVRQERDELKRKAGGE